MKICLVLHRYAVPIDDPCVYPLGFFYVSSKLKKNGHEVKILNYNLWDYDFKEEIKGQDIVGFTGFEEFFPCIKRDSKICREMGIITALGGALATFREKEMRSVVDVVSPGEFEDGTLLPDYDGFGIEEYKKRQQQFHMGVLASRGCPYRCTFCAQTCKYKERDLNDVFNEIDLYRNKYGCKVFVFNDNTLNVRKDRFLEICRRMKDRGTWGAAIRADGFDREMAFYAKRSGCSYFVVGVESFNQAKLDRMNKWIKVDQIYKTLDLLHEFEIDYHGNVLVGFDWESVDDIQEELANIPQNYKVFPIMVQPFIGTKDGKKRGIPTMAYSLLTAMFKKNVEDKGKYCYPELEAT